MGKKILLHWTRLMVLVMTIGLSGMISQESWGQVVQPTVTTDKLDYAPGEVAIISGSGWIGDSKIDIHMDEDPPLHADHQHDFYDVPVDAAGNWSVQFPIEDYHLGVTFYVTVTGQETGRTAEHVFTDAPSLTSISPISGPTSGGTEVTFIGNGYINNSTITVKFGTIEVSGTRNSNQKVTAIAPAQSAGTVDVEITVQGQGQGNSGTATLTGAYTYTCPTIETPVISSASNTSVCPGSSVILNSSSETGNQWLLNNEEIVGATDATYEATESGSYTVIVSQDGCESEPSEPISVTVEDTTPPVVDAVSEITVTLDASGSGSLAVADVLNNASTDACGIASEVLSQTSFGCGDVGTFEITLTVTDVNGNETEKTISVTVEDTTAPVVDAKSSVTVTLDASGSGSLAVADVLNNASTDACGIASEVLSQTSFGCGDVGTFEITLTVTDVNGNETEKTISVTVEDTTAPVVDAKSSVTVTLDASGSGSLAVADVLNNASTDACGIASEVLSQTSFGCGDVGTFEITLTVTDVNGNETEKTISVTVEDTTAPVVDAKSSVTVTLDASGSGSLAVADVLNNASTDACGIASEVLSQTSFGCGDVGTFEITLTVTDVNGNETEKTISVTVEDTTAPVVDAKSSVTVTLDASGSGSLAVADVLNNASTDACGIASEVLSQTSFGCGDVGTFEITLTVTDVNGNETEKTISVTVEDTTAPVVDAKSSVTVTLDASGSGSLAVADVLNNASTDACGIASEVLSQTSFGCGDVGTFEITLTVTDVNGNETEKTISVTVEDTTAPVVDAKSSVTVTLDASGSGSLAVADVLNNASTDACGIASEVLSQTSFGCGDVGTFEITLTVTDVNGNETEKTISVTVEDTTAPVVDAKSSVTVTLDASGSGSLAVADVLNNASTDACGIASEVLSQTSFGCGDVGTFEITLTVTDVNGNETEKTISVTVEDTTAPVVDAKSSVTVTLDASGSGSLAVADVLNNASTDACGIASEVLSQTSFGCGDVGTFEITLTVTDVNGNETEKTISVTVEDTTAPVVDAKSSVTVTLDASGSGSLAVADVLNNASTDACGIASEVLSQTSFGCGDVGTFEITLTVTDVNGNETEKTISVTVEDTTAPVVDAKSSVTVTLDASGSGSLAVADVLNNASTDACGIASEVLSQTSFGCGDVGTFEITLTVTDVNGNETEKTISVTVEDTTAPVVDAKSSVTVTLDASGSGSLAVADVLNNASTDACGIASEVLSQTSFGCGDVGTFEITLTVTDVNGNETEKTISVTVEDTTAPVVDAKSSVTVTLDASGSGSLAVADVLNNASTDACGIASEVLSQTSFGCGDVGTFEITLTVTDVNGNETEKTISVTVEDTTAPVVDAKSSVTVTLDASGSGSLAVADVLNNASTDACGIASEVLSQTSFGCGDVGTFEITLTVTDVNGNETEKTISVTVEDTTAPVVDAKSSVTVTLDASGSGSLAVADVLNNASTDACGIASEVLSQTSFGCGDVGTFEITLTVTDVNGNETEKTISVTVEDTTAPVVDAKSSVTVTLDASGSGSLAVADVL
ncbi:MAG: beta strand repeat-containing protein, partial [Algoriphagus aquaeductus]|uniref:beta strand repeat-containing protein n=1 Tax=Algoriphagus aquaeductus TaxID=475299 RepID=UPI0038798C09